MFIILIMDFKKLVNSSPNVNCTYTNLTKSEKILAHVKQLLEFFNKPDIKEQLQQNKMTGIQLAFEQHTEFFTAYPTLAKLVSEDPYNFDMNRLLEMLNLKDRVANKEISYSDASTGLGVKYYDEYVKDDIKNNK